MKALLQVRGLTKRFASGRRRWVEALRGVDLAIADGQCVGLVGESGCGKTTLGRCVLRLVEPSAGEVWFDGVDLVPLSRRALRPLRRQMQMIFQDPKASLNPRMTIAQTIGEPLLIHRLVAGQAARRERAAELLERVRLSAELLPRYPHQLSAGQRQRVGIARALAVQPRFVVADEPVSALDLPVQAQILELLAELQRAEGLTVLFVSHDLKVVHHLCDEVAVMYLGRIVERAPAAALVARPRHPYSRALLAATRGEAVAGVEGEPPSPLAPPPGCPFHPRCPVFASRGAAACREQVPLSRELAHGHWVACHEA